MVQTNQRKGLSDIDVIKERHSVRQYTEQKIEKEKNFDREQSAIQRLIDTLTKAKAITSMLPDDTDSGEP